MSATATVHRRTSEQQVATFYVGEILLGIDIQSIQEINRHVSTTLVPHAPREVKGVINLRGEVVTVMDLRTILDLEPIEVDLRTRNIIVQTGTERVGLLVDRVADVVTLGVGSMACPASISEASIARTITCWFSWTSTRS
jgi:purine-binding chemotaxis protein CheW